VGKRQPAAPTPSEGQPGGGRSGGAARALTAVDGHAPDATPIDLDRLIHERIRLGIVSALAVNESLSFNALKSLMGTTDGNLSVHARKLEDAGYIRCTKSFEGRMPKTDFALTAAGRTALERYLGHMEAIIKSTREYER
jgi:DNA-binding HxlR family transcriptional regulator